ncbi:hypothetical protein HYFRA_00011207 [Hymenoscyphus fraxineus]|uniref:Uncharacterized protein n=1 Tax=Hymenoscyphus fraxineus TaxID=746836 RepID=A0A9N9L265_9HELO|nr:hypothetical protein HYFRA_00011207 [Hymenoscyphus fraxineus]
MRFNSAGFLLGLAAFSSVPETFGRAVPKTGISLYNENYVRAAPVRITGPKEVPAVKPGSGTPSHTGDKPGGEGTPPRIGTGDKTPSTTPNDKPVHIGDSNVNPDAPSIPEICSRTNGCRKELLSTDKLTERGDAGINRASNPTKAKDYSTQEKDNYKIQKSDFEGVEDSIETIEFDKKYGFDAEDAKGWQTMEVRSNVFSEDPIVKMSVGRSTKDGKDYVAIVAHSRFAENDGARFKQDSRGAPIKENDLLVPAEDAASKSVPVYQLVHDAAQQSGKLDGKKPDKYLLVSENVINDEAKRDIDAAHTALKKAGQPNVMKKDATGEEGKWFKILAGNDNNFSYLNTVGRNPDTFKDYEIISIETRDVPIRTMAIELAKKA